MPDTYQEESRRQEASDLLLRHLLHRPSANELLTRNYLRGSSQADPSIRIAQDAFKFQHNRDHLSRSLRNRKPLGDLVSRHIYRASDDSVSSLPDMLARAYALDPDSAPAGGVSGASASGSGTVEHPGHARSPSESLREASARLATLFQRRPTFQDLISANVLQGNANAVNTVLWHCVHIVYAAVVGCGQPV
jgi:hypothetical protein